MTMSTMTRTRQVGRAAAASVVAAALGATGLIALAPQAGAATENVVGASATWGFKTSFRTYVATGGAANTIATSECATFAGSTTLNGKNTSSYVWPGAATGGTYDSATKAGTINLRGRATFAYPAHYIHELSFANPTVKLDGDGTGDLLIDARRDFYGPGSPAPADKADLTQVKIAELTNVPAPTSTATGDGTTTETFTNITVTLTAAGSAAAAEFYPAGEVIDPLSISFAHGTRTSTTATTTSLAVAPSGTSTTGAAVTLTATVAPAAGGCVDFFSGATRVGTAPVVSGVATLATKALPAGDLSLTAAYVPSTPGTHAGSTSSAVAHSVVAPVKTDTKTTLTLSPSSVAYGSSRTATVTVTRVGGGAVPTGTVRLTKSGTLVAKTTLASNGKANIALSKIWAVGYHPLVASYAGDATSNASASSAVRLTVRKANSKTTAKLAKTKIKTSARGYVSTVVTAVGFVPGGKVQVKKGSKVLATVNLVRGKATIKLPKLAKGKHYLVVRYAGSTTAVASQSARLTLTVTK